MKRTLLLALLLLMPAVAAQSSQDAPTLGSFLATLTDQPSLRAVGEQVASAEARVRAAYDPVSLQASEATPPSTRRRPTSTPRNPASRASPRAGGRSPRP